MLACNTSTFRTNCPIFSNHIINIEKLDEYNYSTWASKIGLWLSGLGWATNPISIDAQICSVIKFNVHTSLKLIFCPHETVHQFGVRPVPFILNFS
ncbi:hypothetical protein PHAVU_007G091700 [Phaseolus vulgaris]|uniref:Uncharacterized protein n=1 Tax=Phaseolus vulgaris TaxID=3885 RepID=V7BDP3_PHAVU|nr:hypothetical protein PHAVU_007G091700g [Phaseolus vulgaris]ESW15665.1 hypothetical protein PHAVU_007G091700g [Phaseolus vulgaris]